MCGCNKGKDAETPYLVTLPNGKTEEVKGEFAARVAITRAGGGSFKKK